MMAQFVTTQFKTNEILTVSINQLNSQCEAMTAHQKVMDTQIALSRLAIYRDLKDICQVRLRRTLEAM